MKDERRLLVRFKDSAKRDAFLADAGDLPSDSIRAEPMADEHGARIVCDGPRMEANARNLATAHGGAVMADVPTEE